MTGSSTIMMYYNAVLPPVAVPSLGSMLLTTLLIPSRFPIWSVLFGGYSVGILFLTV
jgi:hypothetical protein